MIFIIITSWKIHFWKKWGLRGLAPVGNKILITFLKSYFARFFKKRFCSLFLKAIF
jgi:hypothetical protein